MDEHLRRILRQVDEGDPSTFLAAGAVLERAFSPPEIFSDLLERLLIASGAIYQRWRAIDADERVRAGLDPANTNAFKIAWVYPVKPTDAYYPKGRRRHALVFTIGEGGTLTFLPNSTRIPPTYSQLLNLIISRQRLAPPTPVFLASLVSAINNSSKAAPDSSPQFRPLKITSCEVGDTRRESSWHWSSETTNIDVTLLESEWSTTEYRLRFAVTRSAFRDLLRVSIENNLYWGTEYEVQGLILSGTEWENYRGEDEDYEIPGLPRSSYLEINSIEELPAFVREIFWRFKSEI